MCVPTIRLQVRPLWGLVAHKAVTCRKVLCVLLPVFFASTALFSVRLLMPLVVVSCAGKGRRLGKKKLQERITVPLHSLQRVQLYIDL